MHGLDARRVCGDCGATCQVVLSEFVEPIHDPLRAWSDDKSIEKPIEAPACSECGSAQLLATIPNGGACPKCGEARVALVGGSVS
jgi:hypothetical protein